MKKRNHRKTKELDLHGVRHADVDTKVEDFVLLWQCEMLIITGHSMEMKKLVSAVLDRHGFIYTVGVPGNDGVICVNG